MQAFDGLHDEACMDRVIESILRSMTRGCIPACPPVEAGGSVVALGSGFVPVLGRVLRAHRTPTSIIRLAEEASSPLVLATLLDALLHHRRSRWWSMYDEMLSAEEAMRTLARLQRAACIVLSLGVDGWYEDPWDGAIRLTPERGELRHLNWHRSSPSELEAQLRDVVDAVRVLNPDAAIVLTVSHDLPNRQVFPQLNEVDACVMKSSLRVAVDRVIGDDLSALWYWPSYEVVRWSGARFMQLLDAGCHTMPVDECDLVEVAAAIFADAFIEPSASGLVVETMGTELRLRLKDR